MGTDIDYDLLSFWTEMSKEDELGVVIRVAIHIERQLTSIIEERMTAPSHLKSLEFSERLAVVRSLGLPDGIALPIKAISEVRNKHAHRLTYTFDKSAAKNLIGTLNGPLKATYQEWTKGKARLPGTLAESTQPIEAFKMVAAVVLVNLLQWRIEFIGSMGGHPPGDP